MFLFQKSQEYYKHQNNIALDIDILIVNKKLPIAQGTKLTTISEITLLAYSTDNYPRII